LNADESELDRELDRLVDGELSPAAYREMLRRLEQLPDGWRRCALAFLQAQAWRHELSPASRMTLLTELPPVQPRPSDNSLAVLVAGSSTWRRRAGWAFAWAASLVVAIWVARANREAAVAPRSISSPALTTNKPAAPVPALTAPDPSTWTVVVDRGWQTPDGDVALPLYSADAEQARRLLQPRSRLPQGWEHNLRATGRTVRRSLQYSTLQLPDGRDAVIPIEQFEIVPIAFQAVP